jgi:hypothetical protein
MPHLSTLLTLLAKIRLGWKGWPETNTVGYYEHFVNYGRKKFLLNCHLVGHVLSGELEIPDLVCQPVHHIVVQLLLVSTL